MKLLAISTNIFSLPPSGYSGLEMLLFHLVEGLAKRGHSLTVICPEGSRFTQDSIEAIFTALREPEEQSYLRYRGRLESGEFPVVIDSTWERWSNVSNFGRDPQLSILNWFHTSPTVYQSQPPVRWPLWVGLSQAHAEECTRAWGVACRFVRNGIDTEFYKNTGSHRGERWLALGRYTPEKGFLEMAQMAKRLRIGLDLYGDMEIIGNPAYRDATLREADGCFVRAYPGVSREATVELYSKAHGLLHLHRWNEPFSLVLCEAMASGVVPIASRRGGPAEIIRHGKTGFLVDSDEEAAELINRDAVKDINPQEMRRHVELRFSLERFVQDWDKLIQEVASGARW